MSTDHQKSDQNLSFLMQLHAAVRNLRLYPPTNPQVDRAIDNAYSSLKKMQEEQQKGLTIATSEQKLLVNGLAIQDKNLHRPQAVGVMEFLTGFEVHSITFQQTINYTNFKQFIELFSDSSSSLKLDTKLKELLAERKIQHISVDTKRYVAIHDGQEIVNGNDRAFRDLSVSDDELALFVSATGGTKPKNDDPDQLNAVLQLVLDQLQRSGAGTQPNFPTIPLSKPGEATLSPSLSSGTAFPSGGVKKTNEYFQGKPSTLPNDPSSDCLQPQGINHFQSEATGPGILVDNYDQLINALENKEGSPDQHEAFTKTAGVMASLNDSDLEWLLCQPVNKTVTEKLYSRTLKELDKGTLIRVAATLKHKSDVLIANKDSGSLNKGRVVKEAYMRLLRASQEKNIEQEAASNADAKLVLDFDNLPDALGNNLKERLKQPEWSSAVLLAGIENLIQQTETNQPEESIRAFSKALEIYDSVLIDKARNQVVKYAANKMAGMDDGKLNWFFQQSVDNPMAEDLYRSTFDKLDKDTLIRIASNLKFQADLQGESNNTSSPTSTEKIPAKHEHLLNLANDPKLAEQVNRHADVHLLSNSTDMKALTVARNQKRLKDPEWSSSVLLTGVEKLLGQSNKERASAMRFSFTNTTEAFDKILDLEEKEQLAKRAGADLATMDEKLLGLLLVQRYKGIFGDKLYTEVVTKMSDKKFEQVAKELDSLTRQTNKLDGVEGLDTVEVREAYSRLMKTVKGEKMRLIMDIYKQKEQKQRSQRLAKIKKGVKAIINKHTDSLLDDDVSQALPATILRLINNKKDQLADSILDELLFTLEHKNHALRKISARCLAATLPSLTQQNYGKWLDKICSRVDRILQNLDPFDEESKQVSTTLQHVIRRDIIGKHYTRAQDFLYVIECTTDGKWKNDRSLNSLTDKILAGIATHDILTRLLEKYLHNQVLRREAGGVLTNLGKLAAEHLLKALERSDNKTVRMRLIHLLSKMQKSALKILLAQLTQSGPWYFKRNILRLLGAVGDESSAEQLMPYLSHEDLRVQRETLVTINTIGGRHRRKLLLTALKTVPDPLKIQVVTWLGQMKSDNLVYPLTKLIENRSLFSSKVKEELQEAICNALGRIGSPRANPVLQKILNEKPLIGMSGYSERVREAAESALAKINFQHQKKKEVVTLGRKFIPTQMKTTKPKRADIIAEKEAKIFLLAEQNKKEQAKQLLFDLIISCARQKDFKNAERLRDKLYDLDSMALTEIIKAGEIIEQEKTDSIPADELETWKNLYEELSTEEFNVVFQNIEKKQYAPEHAILRQGSKNEELFFINKGTAKVFYRQDNRDIFIKNLGPGDLAAENFFESSVWTVSLTALTAVDLAILTRKKLNSWKEHYPGLETKLQNFCHDFLNVHGQLNKKGLNRRAYKRYQHSPKIKFQMCDQHGKATGQGFKGELSDISLGGLSFLIRISKKENARLLLGRTISVSVPTPANPTKKHDLDGYIMAVQSQMLTGGDYSIHVCFNELLIQEQLAELLE